MRNGELKESIAQEIDWCPNHIYIRMYVVCVCNLSNLHGTVDVKAISY